MKSLLIKFLAASVIVFGAMNFVVAETTMVFRKKVNLTNQYLKW